MGISIKTASGTSLREAATGLVTPLNQYSALRGHWIFETNPELCAKNWASQGFDATMVGSLVMGEGNLGAYFTQATNYLRTQVHETDNFTMIMALEELVAPTTGWPFGNYRGARSVSDTVFSNGALVQMAINGANQRYAGIFSSYSGSAAAVTANVTATRDLSPSGAMRIIALRASEPAGTIEMKDITGGTSTTGTRASGVRDKCRTLPFLIGSNYLARDATPAIKIFDCAVIAQALTDVQIAEYVTWQRAYWARRGIEEA